MSFNINFCKGLVSDSEDDKAPFGDLEQKFYGDKITENLENIDHPKVKTDLLEKNENEINIDYLEEKKAKTVLNIEEKNNDKEKKDQKEKKISIDDSQIIQKRKKLFKKEKKFVKNKDKKNKNQMIKIKKLKHKKIKKSF